jgi:predicted metal-binding membrane protein
VGVPERLIRRDRTVAIAALLALAALAWAATAHAARTMTPQGVLSPSDMGRAMAMPTTDPSGPAELLGLFAMWLVMMVAMMLPAVTPIVILFLGLQRRRHASRLPVAPTAAFLGGYLLTWAGFSLMAALGQSSLRSAALVSAGAMRATPVFAGALLLAAGFFQWTPAKRACLHHCRSPIHFFSTEWQEGTAGALLMGLRHGSWCVGCCWLLMALLFVAGVMNLAWVAALAAVVLLEKSVRGGPALGKAIGVGLAGWGIWQLAAAVR